MINCDVEEFKFVDLYFSNLLSSIHSCIQDFGYAKRKIIKDFQLEDENDLLFGYFLDVVKHTITTA